MIRHCIMPVAVLAACYAFAPSEAAISVTSTQAFGETSGNVDVQGEGQPEEWSDIDNPPPGTGNLSALATDTAERQDLAMINTVGIGTGTADASVTVTPVPGGINFHLIGSAIVEFSAFAQGTIGHHDSTVAQSGVDFTLDEPGVITHVMANLGEVSLFSFVIGDFVPLANNTPLDIGDYQLFGEAFLDEFGVGGDSVSQVPYELDVTISASNGGIAVPEPSSIFAWAIVILVAVTRLLLASCSRVLSRDVFSRSRV